MAIPVPQVSSTELQSFHETHFGPQATAHFEQGFLNPTGHEYNPIEPNQQHYDEEEDGLGHYPDGVKRTLTDEQIAIFRHSEIEALRRERARQLDCGNKKSRDCSLGPKEEDNKPALPDIAGPSTKHTRPSEQATQSLSSKTTEMTEGPNNNNNTNNSNNNNNHNPKKKKKARKEPKPDLRKRTWDVVDRGLDSLNYDDM